MDVQSHPFFTRKVKKGDVKVCRALDKMFEESTNKGIQMGIKQGIELKELQVYQTMLEKGFGIKAIDESLE